MMKRPYPCPKSDCCKSYTTRFSLRRHMTSHMLVKQHTCVICFKSFTLSQYLKEHMFIHTDQKPFQCDFPGCKRAFRQAGKLSLHKKLHTNILFAVQRVKNAAAAPLQPLAPMLRLSSDHDSSSESKLMLVPDQKLTFGSPEKCPMTTEDDLSKVVEEELQESEKEVHEPDVAKSDVLSSNVNTNVDMTPEEEVQQGFSTNMETEKNNQ